MRRFDYRLYADTFAQMLAGEDPAREADSVLWLDVGCPALLVGFSRILLYCDSYGMYEQLCAAFDVAEILKDKR